MSIDNKLNLSNYLILINGYRRPTMNVSFNRYKNSIIDIGTIQENTNNLIRHNRRCLLAI